MNIEISRAALLPALGAVSGVVERRQTLPILGNLLLCASGNKLALRATDLELEVGTQVEAQVSEDGEATGTKGGCNTRRSAWTRGTR